MSEAVFLVPHDFTDVADIAVQQGIKLAERTNGKVVLLHVVKAAPDIPKAEDKLKKIIAQHGSAKAGANLAGVVKAGSIFSDIAKTAEEIKAQLIIMGTHGAKGMQKVFGSFAVKVIASTHIPFMVVQETGVVAESIDRILFPIDINIESLQILDTAKFMAKAFDAEIHLVAEPHKDARLSSKINNRMKVVIQQFKKDAIEYKAEYLKGDGSFYNRVMNYGQRNYVSMFAVSHDSSKILSSLDKFTQSMITNDLGRPTLIINSHAVSKGYF